jgi:hypothetical protein
MWPVQVPQRFVEMVAEKRPEALVVVAYYFVLMKEIEGFWFMNGCAKRLLGQVISQLGKRWIKHIEWPMKVLGISTL